MCQGSVGSVGSVGTFGEIILGYIFLCLFAFDPNFLVLKAAKFALFSLHKCAQTLYISAFRLDFSAL